MGIKIALNPITRKRFRRFKEMKRSYVSFWMLALMYFLSLGSELICNDTPLVVRYHHHLYFPLLKFYPETEFTGNGKLTRPDYKKIADSPLFRGNPDNTMIFPPIPFGPYESIDPETISVSKDVTVIFKPLPKIGTVNIRSNYVIQRSVQFDPFIDPDNPLDQRPMLTDVFHIPDIIRKGIEIRFSNTGAPAVMASARRLDGMKVTISLSSYTPRSTPPKTVRLTFREDRNDGDTNFPEGYLARFNKKLQLLHQDAGVWDRLSDDNRKLLLERIHRRLSGAVDPVHITMGDRVYEIRIAKNDIRFPFPPTEDHLLGMDETGRDVLVRILYGFRTSLTFGLVLVICSMTLGMIAGSLQGYYGGIIDISAQRMIEIWSALPFLYIMILMGSVYGRSFSLLLFCYGLFNWIGISYYVRAEFLRLRKQAFVEAARCMGISSFRIISRHILPNALVPVITFFPFSLVGAIGSLAALDYLGFGLPPPTPSWGELLFQAQHHRTAWWLILYPSLALFIVMLLGVFIGEGLRNAYDPQRYTRLK